jgi:hypothetical protein
MALNCANGWPCSFCFSPAHREALNGKTGAEIASRTIMTPQPDLPGAGDRYQMAADIPMRRLPELIQLGRASANIISELSILSLLCWPSSTGSCATADLFAGGAGRN